MDHDCFRKKNEILCKYYMYGVCSKGDSCQFSHNMQNSLSSICKYFLEGTCVYGQKCRYEHITKSQLMTLNQNSKTSKNVLKSSTKPCDLKPKPTPTYVWNKKPNIPAKKPPSILCVNNVTFSCDDPDCVHIHGDLCVLCNRNILDPQNRRSREEHIEGCKRKEAIRIDTEKLKEFSEEMTCGICLEHVTKSEEDCRFGIMDGCCHCFCYYCICNWRKSSDFDNEITKSCPVCRRISVTIIPSLTWYRSGEEKSRIIAGFRESAKKIMCTRFNRGRGCCPFGDKCLYKHVMEDGREPSPETQRKLTTPVTYTFYDAIRDVYSVD